MSFPTGLVRYYTCTQIEYNRLLADNRIIDNALYYIRNWQSAEGNLSTISNDVTHVYLGKQLIGGTYRYPSGSVLLGGDPNSTRIGSDSWGTGNIFSATNNPGGYDNIIILGANNIATSSNQILLGDRVSWTGKDSQNRDVTPVPANTFFAVGKGGHRYLEITNKANLLVGSSSLPFPVLHNYGTGRAEGNVILPPAVPVTTPITFEDDCFGNILGTGYGMTLKGSGNNIVPLSGNNVLDSTHYTILAGAKNRVTFCGPLLASVYESNLGGLRYSIVSGRGHTIDSGGVTTYGQLIAGEYAAVNPHTIVAIGGGTSTQVKNLFDLDDSGNGQISGFGSWVTQNGYTNFISATDNIRIMTDPSQPNPKYLTLESDNISLVSNDTLNVNTNKIILTGFSGHVPITGVATPQKDYPYSAANVEYVENRLTEVIGGAPGALDTLNELAAALGDDENFATTVTNRFTTDEQRISDLENNKMDWFGDVLVNSTNTTHGYTLQIPAKAGILTGHTYITLQQGRNTLTMQTQNDSSNSVEDIFSFGNNSGKTKLTSPIIQMPYANVLNLSTAGTVVTGVATSTDVTSAVNLGQLNSGLADKMYKWGTVRTTNDSEDVTINPIKTGALTIGNSGMSSYVTLGTGGIIKVVSLDNSLTISAADTGVSITGVATSDGTNLTDAVNVQYVKNCLTVTNW